MGLLSANLKAEMQRLGGVIIPVIDITLPTRTFRYGPIDAPVSSMASGQYVPRVRAFGTLGRSLSDREGGLNGVSGRYVIDDTDLGVLPYVYQMRGRPIVEKWVSPNVPNATDFFLFFTGIITAIEQDGNDWIISVRQDDASLLSVVPKGTITSVDWSAAHPSAIGKAIPIIYGSHDMTGGLGSTGMCPTLYVDTVGFRFAVAGHICKSVPRVYLDGVLKTLTTDYTITYPVVGGRQYTVIDFVANPGTDPVVSCDVDGIESTGTGTSGTLLTEPAAQLKHFLTNFGFGEWTRGAWLADSVLLNAAHFTTTSTFLSALSLLGARYMGQARTVLAELQEWCRDLEITAFWTNVGTLAVLPWEHRIQNAAAYPTPRINAATDVLRGEVALAFNDDGTVTRILSEYIAQTEDGGGVRFLASLETRDTGSLIATLAKCSVLWGPAKTGQANQPHNVSSRRINRYRSLLPLLEVSLSLAFCDHELHTDIGVTWDRGPTEGGVAGWGDTNWQRRPFRLVGLSVDRDRLEVRASLQDIYPSMTSLWANWKSLKPHATDVDGGAFLSIGNWLDTTRASKKWLDDAAATVLEIPNDQDPIDMYGLAVEGASTNDLLNSAFKSGLTSWTQSAGGGTIALDTTDLFWDPNLTGNKVTLTVPGGGLSANMLIWQEAASAYGASDVFSVSVTFKNTGGGVVRIWIQRGNSGSWFSALTRTWSAGVVSNQYQSTAWTRVRIEGVPMSGTGAAIRVYVGVEDLSEVDGQVVHVADIQIEKQAFAGSRILTDGTTVTRAADSCSIDNDASGYEVWPNTRGTIEFVLTPYFTAEWLVGTEVFYLLSLEYDANNAFWVFYDRATQLIKFRVRCGGVNYDASGGAVGVVAPGSNGAGAVEYGVAVRWTSSAGELGLPAGTASVFVGGARGTDVQFTTPPTKVTTKKIYVGAKTGTPPTTHLNGAIAHLRVSPYCKPDAELLYSTANQYPY